DLAALTAEVVTDDALNLANLSTLYRYTQLARGTNLSIADLLTLIAVAGIDPFDASHTENAILFVELLGAVRASGFAIDEIDYLLRHHFSPASSLVPAEDAIAQALGDLRAGLQKIQAQTTPQPDPSGDLTHKKLTLLQWPAGQIDPIVDTLNGRVV